MFFVALVSLPIALACICGYFDVEIIGLGAQLGGLLIVSSLFIALAALYAYKADSNFGFTVFALVAAGVFYAGYYGGDLTINLTLGIIYLVCLIWSARIGTPKTLTVILLTTALIFIFGGISVQTGEEIWGLLKGIAALANFVLTLYLAYALVDEKVPVI